MDLLARFVGIWMVFVFYIAVDVEGAIYGESCTADSDCSETNAAKCDTTDTGNCICEDTYFRKTTAAECASRVALNAVCEVAQTSPEQCTVANSECIDVSGTINCICSTTHFETGGTCALKKALTESCTATTECADPNAECPSSTCVCKSNYFTNKNDVCDPVVAALNGACDATDSATDQCAITDSECRVDGTAKCLCKATHYVDGSACTIRKNPEDTCSGDVCVTHATCDTTCKCDAGYTASPSTNPTMCSGVVKFASLSYMYVVPILVSLMFLVR